MTLEMGLTGTLDKLSGMMITGLCDTLRAFSQNWKAGMGSKVPMIYVTNAQNRFIEAGRRYTVEAYAEVKRAATRLSPTRPWRAPSSCTTNGARRCASSSRWPASIRPR